MYDAKGEPPKNAHVYILAWSGDAKMGMSLEMFQQTDLGARCAILCRRSSLIASCIVPRRPEKGR